MGRLCNVVCVTGASSQLGVFLLPRLRDSGFRVLALGRQAPQKPLEVDERVTWMRTSFLADGERRDQVVRHPPPDLLVSCGPLELALRLVLRYPGLQRIIAFSSSSVVSKSESADRAERRRMAAMVADEDALAAACAERGIPLLLLRPTMIYGCGMDRNVSLLAGLARRYGVIPLARPACGLRQPVHADDLADLAIRALRARPPLGLASPVCGGTTLTYRDMAQRIAAALARRTRLLHLPEGLMVVLVRALSLLPGAPGINTEMVRRQNRDLVFDDSALRQALGWEPRPFEPTSADFAVPAEARTLQLPTALSHRPQERL
jgi:nucleoside-diphosphate-sugar epimerase